LTNEGSQVDAGSKLLGEDFRLQTAAGRTVRTYGARIFREQVNAQAKASKVMQEAKQASLVNQKRVEAIVSTRGQCLLANFG
jgi:hypothetical protein